jgi:hypothetical protein
MMIIKALNVSISENSELREIIEGPDNTVILDYDNKVLKPGSGGFFHSQFSGNLQPDNFFSDVLVL